MTLNPASSTSPSIPASFAPLYLTSSGLSQVSSANTADGYDCGSSLAPSVSLEDQTRVSENDEKTSSKAFSGVKSWARKVSTGFSSVISALKTSSQAVDAVSPGSGMRLRGGGGSSKRKRDDDKQATLPKKNLKGNTAAKSKAQCKSSQIVCQANCGEGGGASCLDSNKYRMESYTAGGQLTGTCFCCGAAFVYAQYSDVYYILDL